MTEHKPFNPDENVKAGMSIQEKFELYLVGLIFTVLAFSLQTAKLSGNLFPDVAECLSWATLLLSGFFGLRRMEHIPQYLRRMGYIEQVRDMRAQHRAALANGNTEAVDEEGTAFNLAAAIREATQLIVEESAAAEIVLSDQRIRYAVMKWALAAGMLLLMVSRSYPVTSMLFKRLCGHVVDSR